MPNRAAADRRRRLSNDDDDAEEAAAALATVDSEFGRTTDPVRMYMREMGTVELLTREGEIRIAKRIEEGLEPGASRAWPCSPARCDLLIDSLRAGRGGSRRRLHRHRHRLHRSRRRRQEAESADGQDDSDDDEEDDEDRGRHRPGSGRGKRPLRQDQASAHASHATAC